MRLLILGGGKGQLSLIKKAKKMGHEVVVSDYYDDAPGKEIADFSSMSSTFDAAANIEVAKKFKVDGVLTAGTDQPVYTAAQVAEHCLLPQAIATETAKAVTNKKNMKNIFSKNKIPTVNYKIIKKDFLKSELKKLSAPYVVKPLDSQGQRGVFKLNSFKEIKEKFNEVLSFSREEEILVEEYYPSAEITVSGWVSDGSSKLLTVTDRLRFEENIHIGICSSHLFPSKYLKKYYLKIKKLSQKIVSDFKIENGPIYFQFLIGREGIKVNEIACRIGGAYEGDFMPALTGVDIFKMMIQLAAGNKVETKILDNYKIEDNKKHLSSQLFFAKAGKIKEITDLSKIEKMPGILKIGINYSSGEIIPDIENATARAGYFIVIANSKKELKARVSSVYNQLQILDQKANNLILREIGEKFKSFFNPGV